MSQYTFTGIWSLHVFPWNGPGFVVPHGTNFALWENGSGDLADPANCYNLYSTPKPSEYIFQSQLNGLYVGMTSSRVVWPRRSFTLRNPPASSFSASSAAASGDISPKPLEL